MPDGIRDDTFLHLVDAWWEGEVERRRAAGELPEELGFEGMPGEAEIQEGFDDFKECKGDRFRNRGRSAAIGETQTRTGTRQASVTGRPRAHCQAGVGPDPGYRL